MKPPATAGVRQKKGDENFITYFIGALDFGKRQKYRSTKLTLIVYKNELARTLPPERETAGKSIAMIWSSPRVKMPPGVKSGQS